MPAIDFPNSPSINDSFVSGGKRWVYNGDAWILSTPATYVIANDEITSLKIIDGAVTVNKLGTGAVTSDKILDGTIVNTDISASAAIAATKISGTALVASTFTAKGDLLAATASGTVASLPVGATGYVLTVDPAEATGVKWSIIPPSGGLSTTTEGAIMTMDIGA